MYPIISIMRANVSRVNNRKFVNIKFYKIVYLFSHMKHLDLILLKKNPCSKLLKIVLKVIRNVLIKQKSISCDNVRLYIHSNKFSLSSSCYIIARSKRSLYPVCFTRIYLMCHK